MPINIKFRFNASIAGFSASKSLLSELGKRFLLGFMLLLSVFSAGTALSDTFQLAPLDMLQFNIGSEKVATSHYGSYYTDSKIQNEIIPFIENEEEEDVDGTRKLLLKRPLLFIASNPIVTFCSSAQKHAEFSGVLTTVKLPDTYLEFIQVCRI